MPKYAKFLKDFLSNKRNLEQAIKGTAKECAAVIQRSIPQKLADPGRFSLPCTIGQMPITYALADLGASVNLMPSYLYGKLNLGKPQPLHATIELADGSTKEPDGLVENLLVKIGKFVFSADFVILDMGEDNTIPLILGQPFLATARAMTDMSEGILKLCVGNEEINYTIGGQEYVSNDPFDVANFIDTHLDYHLKKAKGIQVSPTCESHVGGVLRDTAWIDQFWDTNPKWTKKKTYHKRGGRNRGNFTKPQHIEE